jgi:hypothetical protein
LRRSKAVGTLTICIALAAVGWVAFGGAGAATSLLVGFPVAAWRHDNEVGACFPLAVLLVIVILIMIAFMALLGWLWARHQ